MLRLLYTSLIRPHLDYALVIWNPYQLGDIHLLEQVLEELPDKSSSSRIFHITKDLEVSIYQVYFTGDAEWA